MIRKPHAACRPAAQLSRNHSHVHIDAPGEGRAGSLRMAF
jgi:hypothetical protein